MPSRGVPTHSPCDSLRDLLPGGLLPARQQRAGDIRPFLVERCFGKRFPGASVPICGIRPVALDPVQMGMHPRSFGARSRLYQAVSGVPFIVGDPPECLERWGKAFRRGRGSKRCAEFVQGHGLSPHAPSIRLHTALSCPQRNRLPTRDPPNAVRRTSPIGALLGDFGRPAKTGSPTAARPEPQSPTPELGRRPRQAATAHA